jgi:hypothetical protein
MKWNIFLVIVSITILWLLAGSGLIMHLAAAESIADDLAPQIGVDRDVVRRELETILERGNMRRTIAYCTPWAFMSLLLTTRLVVDFARAKRQNCGPPEEASREGK